MCGRYLRRSDKQRIAEYFHTHGEAPFPLPPDYNIAPTTHQPVIRANRDTGHRELVLMRWGLVPNHAKSLAEYKGISTINARAENIDGHLWRRLFERQRCLVPADGFYEWQTLPSALHGPRAKKAKSSKKPFVFSLNDDIPFAFAGLWDAWKDPATSDWLQSFSIVTTEANELLSSIHTRMPVILQPRDYTRWLDRSPTARLPYDLLRSYDSTEMRSAPANPQVNNARNNGAEMLNPPDEPEDGELPLNPA